MRHSQRLLRVSAVASAWALAASLASAQDQPLPSTPPEGVQQGTPEQEGMQDVPAQHAPANTPQVSIPTTTPDSSSFTMESSEPMVDEPRFTFPNRPLLITSSAIFAAPYLTTVIYQGAEDRNQNLYIPVAGPWLDLAKGRETTASKTLLSIDGVLQGLGAIGMLASLVIPERRTRNWYLLGSHRKAFDVSPVQMSRDGYGMLAHGRF